MGKANFIEYKDSEKRKLFLKINIKNLEDFFPLEKLADIFAEYSKHYHACKSKNIKMDYIDKLELYNSTLMSNYNKV